MDLNVALFQWKLLKLSVFADYPFSNLLIYIAVNSLTTKKQTTKLSSDKISSNVKSKLYRIGNSKTRGQTV